MKRKGFKAAPARRRPAPKAAGRLGLLALLLALATPALFYAASRARAQVRRPANVKTEPRTPARTAAPDAVETKKARPARATQPKPQAPVQTKPQAPAQRKPEAPVLTAAPAPRAVTSARIRPVSATKVSFKQVAEMSKRARLAMPATRPTLREAPVPGSIRDTPAGAPLAAAAGDSNAAAGPDDTGGPLAPSPSPSQSFLGQEDGPKVGTTSFLTPPDTNGAVGLNRVFTNTNTNYRIHDKATGAPLSTVSTDTFWAASGGSGFFDPQIQYDPYNQRWILAIVSNAAAANSSISVAVSQTSDPAGSYNVFRFVVGCAGGAQDCDPQGEWADFPMLGFNKNWLAVTVNMFELAGTGPGGSQQTTGFRALVLDYPSARAGSAVTTLFRGLDPDHAGFFFCVHPVTTYSATEEALYLPQHQSSGAAWYSLSRITGTPAAPSFDLGETMTRPGGGWAQPGGDILPQQCVAGPGAPTPTHLCPATPRRIDAGDSFIRSNPVFRNGRVYYAQTVGLPADGLTRTAAQWTALDAATGNYADGGRVDDPTATDGNGGRWYAYPSLSVNKNGDILLGFSEFESDDYAEAGYAFRLATDPAGTMRDPVVYKEGEDYYEKTFSGTRNRWGDYSHTVVDPANDRDLWTVQEYAQARVGTTGTGVNDSRWGTWWAKVTAPAAAGDLVISEFRLFGPNGPAGSPAPEPNEDEFVEIYNTGDSPFTVTTLDGSAGYSVAASDGVPRCTIPSGTVIPGRGHFLCANSDGYSLGGHPAGPAATATPNAVYTNNIPNNAGIALFNTANPSNYSAATRLDAAGPAAEANALYREGAGYPALTQRLINYALYRDTCWKGGSMTTLGACPSGGFPRDTNDNAADFLFVDTGGNNVGAGTRLGAPGPENLSSPVQRNSQVAGTLLDPSVGASSPPNRVRGFASDPANNSAFGTLLVRRTITNNTGAPVTRLRFRVIDLTTYPPASGYADLRARTSSATPTVPTVVTISGANTACPSQQCAVQQTALETPPAQPNGGGFNSTLAVVTVTTATPIPPGGQINVQFMLGIQRTGTFKFYANIETLP
jgi:hypothetical protein